MHIKHTTTDIFIWANTQTEMEMYSLTFGFPWEWPRSLIRPLTIRFEIRFHLAKTTLHAVICFLLLSLSPTLRIASKIYPWGSSIRHAKVKTSYCHLEWLNVYQARRCTLAYETGLWHPLRETLTEYWNPQWCGLYALMQSYSTILQSLVTLKARVEWTHSLRGSGCHLL